ncbi:family 78 glycoside hydrolase catalytic domain [Proteiniphilum sp.]|uniref:alpha-L-rhamnosidase n=1 Tax=Proteiniphilum sp. TaxID=1926877 RepID=UPI003327C37C
MKKFLLLQLIAGCLFLMTCTGDPAMVKVERLRCEMLVNPVGIDNQTPRLTWEITADVRNVYQTAYHILVASSEEKLHSNECDLWDSGKIKSGQSVYVTYEGEKLKSRDECFWKVKVYTNKGMSEWSSPASWSMGLADQSDWQAKWTGLDKSFSWDNPDNYISRLSARYFRKEFRLDQDIQKATLYISGLGFYKLHLNGEIVGDQELAPTPTDYTKTVTYNTFDVTQHIKKERNTIGVILGNGRYFSMRPKVDERREVRHFGFPKMIVQLEIEFSDGSGQTIISDDSWKVTADGAIRSNNEFDGEEYDATKEMPGWDMPNFDDSLWLNAELVDPPGGRLKAQQNKNMKVMSIVRPLSITEIKRGIYIMDMGQNMVGWLRMKVKGKKGDRVKLCFAELLNADGTLYTDNLRTARVTDIYTLKGSDEEIWNPVFAYHGFRFVEITGFPGIPSINDFEGQVIYDEMDRTGHFETSDSTINRIYKNACWGIKGNYRGMPTDCPQRDERMGWLGDRATGSLGESFIFDHNNLYSKWLGDIEDAQLKNGSIPDVVPNYWSMYRDNMTWPGAYLIIANMLYEQFGNMEPIIKHYDSMKKWLYYMRDSYMEDNIMLKDRYGDWCMPPESPELIHSQDPARKTEGAVLGTTFYYHMLTLLERFAKLQGKLSEAEEFADQALKVKDAFNDKFLNTTTGQYSNNTVTANLLPLCYGMVPEQYRESVFKNVVDKTMGEYKGHVSTGLVGIQWLMRGLSDNGRPDIALKIATNRSYPSWGYMIDQGATTIWELWNGDTAMPSMNSANHVMLLGDLIVWFHEYLAGIQNKKGNIAFKEIMMRPLILEGLDYVKADFRSVHGLIKSSWKKQNGYFIWDITIPCNTTATICVPAISEEHISESGKRVASVEGLTFKKMDNGYAVFEVGSGKYHFTSMLDK